MTQLVKEREQLYFRKGSRNRKVMVEVAPELQNAPKKAIDSIQEVIIKSPSVSLKMTKGEKMWILICVLISISFLGINLYVQNKQIAIDYAIQQYQTQINELENQTNEFRSNISKQYNYEAVKNAAEKEGLSKEITRVRTVE